MANEQVDTRQFNAMCHQLATLSAQKFDKVVVSEVKSVLSQTVKNTPAIKVGKTVSRHRTALYSAQPASMYLPKHSYKHGTRLTKNGYVTYYLKNRYPDALWSEISARRAARLRAVLAARGLAQKSWDQIAEKLGVTLDIPNYVRRATPSDGGTYDNVSARQEKSDRRILIEITNAQPTVNIPQVGGARALERAVKGRIKFFEQNANRAVFGDVKKIATAYPGFKMKLAA
jgi:hypothetical protein